MNKSAFIQSLEPRFRQPDGYRIGYYASNRGRVRYGVLQAGQERAFALFTSGLGAHLEMDYENARTSQI